MNDLSIEYIDSAVDEVFTPIYNFHALKSSMHIDFLTGNEIL